MPEVLRPSRVMTGADTSSFQNRLWEGVLATSSH